jgi:hypothetical protein
VESATGVPASSSHHGRAVGFNTCACCVPYRDMGMGKSERRSGVACGTQHPWVG